MGFSQGHRVSHGALFRALLGATLLGTLVAQQDGASRFGSDAPPDGTIFYSFPGTRFSLPTIYAFDDDLNATEAGTIIADNSFWFSEETLSGIVAGYNPYPSTLPKWQGGESTATMKEVDKFTNRTVIEYSFIDESIEDFKLIPDPYRKVCIKLKDVQELKPAFSEKNFRCYQIYVQLPPIFLPGCPIPTQPEGLVIFINNCPRRAMKESSTIGVGQQLESYIYFQDYNRDGTPECRTCDQVVISVLSDPGLPNGASLRQTFGGKDDTKSPAEYTNQMSVQYKTTTSDPVFNHLFSRKLSFTPLEEQSVTYGICVEAMDVMHESKTNYTGEMRTPTVTQCLSLNVVLPETMVLTSSDESIAAYPNLPLGQLEEPEIFLAAVKCEHKFSVNLYEAKDFDLDVLQTDAMAGFEGGVYMPIAVEDPEHPLPPGAMLSHPQRIYVCADMTKNCAVQFQIHPVAHQVLTWVPTRGMEGNEWTSCMYLQDEKLSAAARGQRLCTKFVVNKCEICTRHGDTLLSIATEYGTDWLQLWGANPTIGNPFDLREIVEKLNNKLVLGPLTELPKDEPTAAVAKRFRMTTKMMFLLNPDLDQDEAVIPAGSTVCVIPDICSQPGDVRIMSV